MDDATSSRVMVLAAGLAGRLPRKVGSVGVGPAFRPTNVPDESHFLSSPTRRLRRSDATSADGDLHRAAAWVST
ncbi:hypothetical protein SZMC14600_20174 [Saccharomonospora azurea SZMC 14600]|nr:hypothetical protein SZMC14600_20174 [Saccharomonospora azurea SZMC 14600]